MQQQSIRAVARDLRCRARLDRPPYSTTKLVLTAFPNALVTGDELPDGVDEATSETPEGGVILYRRALPICEQRFAIMHGLAHLIWDAGRVACADAWHERRADNFAAETLVPLEDLSAVWRVHPSRDPDRQRLYLDHVDQISSMFNAPVQVIRMRIRELAYRR